MNYVKRFPVELDQSLSDNLKDCSYYTGLSQQDIAKRGLRNEVDLLLVQYRTSSEISYTAECGLLPPSQRPKKILVKKGVKNNG